MNGTPDGTPGPRGIAAKTRATGADRTVSDATLAWRLVAPAIVLLIAVAIVPLAATVWESLHRHDLRLPWLGQSFVGAANYTAAFADERFLRSLRQTVGFVAVSVTLEIALGLALALTLDRLRRGRALARVIVLLPWALPTVVAALVWRFMFDGEAGLVNATASSLGLGGWRLDWFSHPLAAWVPIVLGDVWKTTPFVALLLLAGLQTIDPALHEAARLDGAGAWRRFTRISLPLLRPALVVALVFRTLDAFRVFDLVYVLTGGGPGTATEVISLTAFTALFQDLRFGYGSALSVIVFLGSFVLAFLYVRLIGRQAVSS
jgi:ABC-type sugar transport system permease subunit